MRKTKFVNGEYYHIYNRGVDKRKIFLDEKDYLKFLEGLKDFNNESSYEQRAIKIRAGGEKELSSFTAKLEKNIVVVCYCLNLNHFHLILQQVTENGIQLFLHKLGTSYTNYFNKKYKRSGSLFQGTFKAVHINTNDYLVWLSGYINGNSEIHKIALAKDYKWSSYREFLSLDKKDKTLESKDIILLQFKNLPQDYENFVSMVIKESRKRKDMEQYFLEKF